MGFRRGVSEVPHGVPMIGSRSMLAVRYGDTTAMSADGRLLTSLYRGWPAAAAADRPSSCQCLLKAGCGPSASSRDLQLPTLSGPLALSPHSPTRGCRVSAGSAIRVHDSPLNCFADGNQDQSGLPYR